MSEKCIVMLRLRMLRIQNNFIEGGLRIWVEYRLIFENANKTIFCWQHVMVELKANLFDSSN